MVRSTLFVALAAAVSASLALGQGTEDQNEAITFVPGAFIFEFEDNQVNKEPLRIFAPLTFYRTLLLSVRR